ncbi:MAG: teichoic acid transporter [Firmicutes bacterium]|nr:teichoic acid transporter [Bacillota bacterium]
MRIKYIIKNVNVSLISSVLITIFNFIARTFFITKLGQEYLGLNSILTNVLSMLSIAELGIGTAIGFSLYKPLANNDKEKIKSLMNYYKRAYQIIGLIIFVMGICIIPFLGLFITNMHIFNNIYLIYFLFLINTVYAYFFSYKRTLIIADQKNYVLTKYLTTFKIIIYILDIIYLSFGNSFIVYLLIQLIVGIIENIYINYNINKRYEYIKEKNIQKLDNKERNLIVKNIKAMFFHKIGDYCVNSTDNLIIAHYISTAIVGIYSNYYTIIYTVNSFLMLIFDSTSASFGNLIAKESKKIIYEKFKTFNFLAFWLFGWSCICFYFLLTPFITTIWLDGNWLISKAVVLVVVLNYFFTSMRVPLGIVKTAGGVYNQDKYVPLIQSLVNLVVSIILVKKIGLLGVFIGTLASSVLVVFWIRPYIVYKHIFERPLNEYFKIFTKYFISLISIVVVLEVTFNLFTFSNNIINFIFMITTIIILPNLVFYIIYRKTNEFGNLLNIAKGIVGGKFGKKS